MKSYLYEIMNIKNGKKYIGQTKNIEKRKNEHFSQLEKGIHHSIKLQRAYNIYGKDSFVFSYKTVEHNNENDIYLLEILEIETNDSYRNGYNSTIGGEGNKTLFTYKESCAILKLLNEYEALGRELARALGCDKTSIYAIANNENLYSNYLNDYDENFYNRVLKEINLKLYNIKGNSEIRFSQKLNNEEMLICLCIIKKYDQVQKSLSEKFSTSSKTFYNATRGLKYKAVKNAFDELEDNEINEIADKYYVLWGIDEISKRRFAKGGVKKRLTEAEIHEILDSAQNETIVSLSKRFDRDRKSISDIINGKTYKQYYASYLNKNKI